MGLFDKDLLTSQSKFETFVGKLQGIMKELSMDYPCVVNNQQRQIVTDWVLNEIFKRDLGTLYPDWKDYGVLGINVEEIYSDVDHSDFIGLHYRVMFNCYYQVEEEPIVIYIYVYDKGVIKTKMIWPNGTIR